MPNADTTGTAVGRGAGHRAEQLQAAMSAAVREAKARGVTDPAAIMAAKRAARDAFKASEASAQNAAARATPRRR